MPKHKKMIIPMIGIILTFAGYVTYHGLSHAQLSVQTITITPPTIQQVVNPGDKKEGTLSVINDSDGDLTFVTSVYDFVVTDTHGTPQILPAGTIANNKYSAANWVAVYPAEFSVKARQRVTINYYLQVPGNAGPGGHYAAIVYQPITAGAQQGTGAHIQSQIATLVYFDVAGPIKEGAKVTKFSANPFQEYGPVDIKTQILNMGDLHINPQGYITLKDMVGKTIATVPLAQRNIFPGNVALDYTTRVGEKWMIGRFQANLVASYGVNQNLPLSATIYFWVFPWRVSIVVILIIVALVLGYFLWKRRKEREEEMEHLASEMPTEKTDKPEKAS